MTDLCPCGSGRTYEECCSPFHRGETRPATAEALMRARYTAFVRGEIPFLRESCTASARQQFDDEAARRWSRDSEWKGLEIIHTERGAEKDEHGTVEFIARYRTGDKDVEHHEFAKFVREEDGWRFVDSRVVGVDPYVRDTPKVGRNDPCPCGSGKKHKKCCGP